MMMTMMMMVIMMMTMMMTNLAPAGQPAPGKTPSGELGWIPPSGRVLWGVFWRQWCIRMKKRGRNRRCVWWRWWPSPPSRSCPPMGRPGKPQTSSSAPKIILWFLVVFLCWFSVPINPIKMQYSNIKITPLPPGIPRMWYNTVGCLLTPVVVTIQLLHNTVDTGYNPTTYDTALVTLNHQRILRSTF